KYQELVNDKISKYELPDGGGVIEVIAGQYKDVKGSAFTFSPINLQNAKLNKGAVAEFEFPKTQNTGLLVIEGRIQVNGVETVETDHFVLFENSGERFTIE